MVVKEIYVLKNMTTGWKSNPFLHPDNQDIKDYTNDLVTIDRKQWDHEYELYNIGLYDEDEMEILRLPEEATAILIMRIGKLPAHKNMAEAMKYEMPEQAYDPYQPDGQYNQEENNG